MAYEAAVGLGNDALVRDVLHFMEIMQVDLRRHKDQQRAKPSAVLALRPRRNLDKQHLFPHFDSFHPVDTSKAQGTLLDEKTATAQSPPACRQGSEVV